MADIKAFRKANALKQEDLARYLGVNRTYISLVETGSSKLSSDKLNMLLNNEQGWSTDALRQERHAGIEIHGNGCNNSGMTNTINNGTTSDKDVTIAVQAREIELLRQQIDFLQSLVQSKQ